MVGNIAALARPLRHCRGRGQRGRRKGARRARRRPRGGGRGPRGHRGQAEELAAKPVDQVHWKNDTARMRELLDEWKEAQRSGARMAKEAERDTVEALHARAVRLREGPQGALRSARQGERRPSLAPRKNWSRAPRRWRPRPIGIDRAAVQAAHGPVALAGRGRTQRGRRPVGPLPGRSRDASSRHAALSPKKRSRRSRPTSPPRSPR